MKSKHKMFDYKLVDKARDMFALVFADSYDGGYFIGSQYGYYGVRLRIYPTNNAYCQAYYVYSNKELKQFIKEWENGEK